MSVSEGDYSSDEEWEYSFEEDVDECEYDSDEDDDGAHIWDDDFPGEVTDASAGSANVVVECRTCGNFVGNFPPHVVDDEVCQECLGRDLVSVRGYEDSDFAEEEDSADPSDDAEDWDEYDSGASQDWGDDFEDWGDDEDWDDVEYACELCGLPFELEPSTVYDPQICLECGHPVDEFMVCGGADEEVDE